MQERGRATKGPDEITPLQNAHYIVAFHRDSCVRMLGYVDEVAARAMYETLSQSFAKVLVNKQHFEVSILYYAMRSYVRAESVKVMTSLGHAPYIEQCTRAIQRL